MRRTAHGYFPERENPHQGLAFLTGNYMRLERTGVTSQGMRKKELQFFDKFDILKTQELTEWGSATMKLLLVQLSDMHCHVSDRKLTKKIEKAVDALGTLSPIDRAVLIFSGDLTNDGIREQFEIGKHMVGRFLSKLSDKLGCGFIKTLIVPGNHDMILPVDARSAAEINRWDKNEHLEEELGRLSSFFDYAKTKRCFETDKILDIITVPYDGLNVQFCLINSAPYSTREKEDKQLHYLPAYVGEKLSEPTPERTLKISVCHHSYEWFDWDSKEMLRRSLAHSDVVFFGHDHKPETISISSSSGANIKIVMGGLFTLDCNSPSTFNALIFDSESQNAEQFELTWEISDQIFVPKNVGTLRCTQPTFCPSEVYLNQLLMDNEQANTNLLKYFTLPKLVPTGNAFSADSPEEINVDDIFSTLVSEKAVKIVGRSRAGKTSLLKYLYSESIRRDYFPLLIEKKDYRDSRIDRMFRDMVEVQYTYSGDHGYDIYEQKDHAVQIVFIDDIDLIQNAKARRNLIDYILSSGRLLVYSTKDNIQDLEEVVKERLQGSDTCSFEISPFYKVSRDALIENVCRLTNKSESEKATVIAALDYLVQCQAGFFSLDPGSLLQYINFFLNEGTRESKGIETLSLVFETNIRSALLSHIGGENINVVLSALEYIADHMYFSLRKEFIEVAAFEKVVADFNQRRKASMNAKRLLKICQDAHILREEQASFAISFSDKNTFAYFVAKYINREYERNPGDLTKLRYVINHICFGINDAIVLFLSFIRSNTRVVLALATKALELLEAYPEWDFEKNNIPFLTLYSSPGINPPTREDTKIAKKQTEQVEKDRQELVKFRGIFDYSDEDMNKEKFKIVTALKYTQLIGRALIDQYGSLDAQEIDQIVKTLYSAPQKIIYAALKPYQNHYHNIIESIQKFVEIEMPEEKITENEIKEEFAKAGTILALNIMNDIAYNSSNRSTIDALQDAAPATTNYKIMQLMMQENVGNTEEFVNKAVSLWSDLVESPYAKTLIAKIAWKHLVYNADIDHRQIDKLVSGRILSEKGKKRAFFEQGTKAQE